MAIKTVLANLNNIDRLDAIVGIAIGLASDHDAHLVGLYVIPQIPIYSMMGFEVTPDIFETFRTECEKAASTARAAFEKRMQKTDVRWEWRTVESDVAPVADATIEHGREADLLVIGQVDRSNPSSVENEFAERVVMEVGRPVLLVPRSGRFGAIGRKVVVGWNGKREAARAAFDAVPILRRAESVNLTWIDPQKSLDPSASLPGAELATSLSRHGVKVTAEGYPTSALPEGVALQQRVGDIGADLLVMGAYGHSRMREIVFGGATRFMLDHMRVPVLMSH